MFDSVNVFAEDSGNSGRGCSCFFKQKEDDRSGSTDLGESSWPDDIFHGDSVSDERILHLFFHVITINERVRRFNHIAANCRSNSHE